MSPHRLALGHSLVASSAIRRVGGGYRAMNSRRSAGDNGKAPAEQTDQESFGHQAVFRIH
jgi:hypothetical protein